MAPLHDDEFVPDPAARQVLQLLEAGGYHGPSRAWVSIGEAQARAEAGTILYSPSDIENLCVAEHRGDDTANVRVTDATTQEAAHHLSKRTNVVLLNFASGTNPGGGFLTGAPAQEEDLCRCSGLFPILLTQPDYYRANRERRSALYTDHLIYSPRVPFFRVGSQSDLLDEPFLASVITAPAPNAGAIPSNDPDIASRFSPAFERRWANVLAVSQDQGHRTVVLGAWGCGAFCNDPHLVASAARVALDSPRFFGAFDDIVFAIPNAGKRGKSNFEVFSRVLVEL